MPWQLAQNATLAASCPPVTPKTLPAERRQLLRLVAQSPRADDLAFARRQLVERNGKPARADHSVARFDHDVFGRRRRVDEQILPLVVAVDADSHVERMVVGARRPGRRSRQITIV